MSAPRGDQHAFFRFGRPEKAAVQSNQDPQFDAVIRLRIETWIEMSTSQRSYVDYKMRAIVAEEFGGYQNLKPADIPKPAVSDGRVLVRMTAAGVTPLDHTILSGNLPMAKAPLVLGNEGAGIVEGSGEDQFPDGSRVMFTGPYGVFENGAFSEWVA